MRAYHDGEWGVPLHDDNKLFEMLVLEGAQAGLSWSTILKKRSGYQDAFSGFEPRLVAAYTDSDIGNLLKNPRIVRNRLKVSSVISNARACLALRTEFDSFDAYIWHFTDGVPTQNRWDSLEDVPTKTSLSDEMSGDMKRRGFKFVGSTICYAFMQAIGMVNDHTVNCFRHREL